MGDWMVGCGNAYVGQEDALQVAGRAVLRGALSLALVVSLVPARSMDVLAEELRALEERTEAPGVTISEVPGDGHGDVRPDGEAAIDEDTDPVNKADTEAPLVVEATMRGVRPSDAEDVQTVPDTHDDAYFLRGTEGDVAIALRVRDESGIASVSLFDPRDEYRLEGDSFTCGPDELLEVTLPPLREGIPLRDDVVMTIVDAAGNERTWSIAERGATKVGSVTEEAENVALVSDGIALGHPGMLVLDDTAPVVTLSGVPDGAGYVQPGCAVRVKVEEEHLASLKVRDPSRVLATLYRRSWRGGEEEVAEVIRVGDLGNDGVATITLGRDGHYRMEAGLTDLAGNRSKAVTAEGLAVDTTPPVLTVAFDQTDPRGTCDNVECFDAERVATISVVEDNFDEGLMDVQVAHAGQVLAEPKVGAWEHEGDVHTLTVVFGEGEGYTLSVSGRDEAGNRALLDGEPERDAYKSDAFSVDLTSPTLTSSFEGVALERAALFEGVPYIASEFDVAVTLSDRNLDLGTLSTVVDGDPVGADAWEAHEDEDGTLTCTLVVHYAQGWHQTPEVVVFDQAGHEARLEARPFVVDLTAPEISFVRTANGPSSYGRERPGDDPTLFFDEPTSLTFGFRDRFGIGSVRLVDPHGTYSVLPDESGLAKGATEASLSIGLAESGGSRDTEFGRDAYLEVTDLAGNYRIWTLDHVGTVVDEIGSSPENATLNGEGIHPLALVKDTVPPALSLWGVEAGRYYNTDQTLHVQVEEAGFAYLQRLDGSRPVLRIRSVAGDASRQASSIEVGAALFAGAGTSYSFEHLFGEDGHYVIEAQLVDMAGNVSAAERVDEFTIDKTAPVISLSFDGGKARDGRYFNAERVATIVVHEHNFDPALMDIETSGTVGTWRSEGDVHTCTVSFGEGGPHSLVVSGRDRAGNAANTVSEPEFVIDSTPPAVSFGGVAQRVVGGELVETTLEPGGAYNAVVAPAVTLTDDRELDGESISLSVRGYKVGEVTEAFPHDVVGGKRSWAVAYEDFGRTDGDGGPSYDVNVDDVYTIDVRACDLAGNEAVASITFSVNRFGSNFFVTAREEGREVDLSDNPILDSPPTITVHEVNVSGADPEGRRSVLKEFANRTSVIERDDDGEDGFGLEEGERDPLHHGWAEYVYTIRSANFGQGSSSDVGDGGQGTYRVNVTSDDRAGNANTTAEFWSSDRTRSEATAKVATASFTLDELGPSLEDVDLPSHIAPHASFEASFRVLDAITRGNDVEVYVDGERVPVLHEGRELAEGELVGEGLFSFRIPARSFAARKVTIKVSDYAHRMVQREASGLFVTTLVPELLVVMGALGAVMRALLHRRG